VTATLQLAFPVDGEPDEGERVAIEATVERQHVERAAAASFSRPCRCEPGPWPDGGHCMRCGRELTSP
jgi:hypothetical protein